MINVIIPSYKRSHDLKGKDYFYMAKYCIPESQLNDYLQVLPIERIITIPDSEDGSITKKRNWILKNIERPLIMIDDDVKRITHTEGGEYFKSKGRAKQQIEVDKSLLADLFVNWVNLANEFDVKLWGINVNTDGRNYQQYKPFSLSQVILGPFQGHLKHDLLFDDNVGTKDDYDMSIQQLNKYRKVLRFNKFAYDCEHGDNKGGIVSYRSMEKEIEYCKNIMLKWGTSIIEYKIPPTKMTDLLNAKKVNIPIKGV